LGFCFYAKGLPECVQAGIPLGEYIMVYFLSDRGIRQLTDNDEIAKKTRKKTFTLPGFQKNIFCN